MFQLVNIQPLKYQDMLMCIFNSKPSILIGFLQNDQVLKRCILESIVLMIEKTLTRFRLCRSSE